MNNYILKTAAILGALSIALGAFAAHGLKKIVSEEIVTTFQTGVTYQIYHVFALLGLGIIYAKYKNRFLKNAFIFFVAGIFLFSGSLFLYTIKEAQQLDWLNWIVFITPFGGIAFILGWLYLFLGIKKIQ
jgi:uncharacterized membrane protein YgdD (TMEM256/DUF423 family)